MRPVGTLTLDRKAPSRTLTLAIVIASLAMGFFSPDPWPLLLGMFIFLFFFRRFFDQQMPPVLLFSFIVQWLFFQAQLFDGLARDIRLDELDFISDTKTTTTILGLVAVFSYFLGLHLTARRIPHYNWSQFVNFLKGINLE